VLDPPRREAAGGLPSAVDPELTHGLCLPQSVRGDYLVLYVYEINWADRLADGVHPGAGVRARRAGGGAVARAASPLLRERRRTPRVYARSPARQGPLPRRRDSARLRAGHARPVALALVALHAAWLRGAPLRQARRRRVD